MTRLYTATERKEASRQALALLTASNTDHIPEDLISDLIASQGDNLPLVAASVVGLASGLLKSFDDQYEGAGDSWLRWVGRRIESMPEGGE